ncbi:MAG: glycosyl hydrolase family 28-related protein, partial [Acutalibacteraceae bacterium]
MKKFSYRFIPLFLIATLIFAILPTGISAETAANSARAAQTATLLDADELHSRIITVNNDAPSLCSNTKVYSGEGSYLLQNARQRSVAPRFQTTGDSTISINIADTSQTILSVWLYLDEASIQNTSSVTLELTSSGRNDADEYQWSIPKASLQSGWHYYSMNFASGTGYTFSTIGSPDSHALNFMRVFAGMTGPACVYVDELKLTGSATVVTDFGYLQEKQILGADDCTDNSWTTNRDSVIPNTSTVYRGTASFELPCNEGTAYATLYSASAVQMSLNSLEDFYIKFRMYITDGSSGTLSSMYLELTSSGKCDVDEYSFSVSSGQYSTRNAWQEITIHGTSYNSTSTPPDLQNINFMRLVCNFSQTNSDCTVLIDDIRLISYSNQNNIVVSSPADIQTVAINPTYATADTVICDLNAVKYGADPTGVQDSSMAIQGALNAVAAGGGGTVWLPKGKYRITKQINIPMQTTLRGDWQNPDTENLTDYGTVILAYIPAFTTEDAGSALFKLNHSSGAVGLTVYYPEQTSLSSVKTYGFTFYLESGSTCTVANCTVLNGYMGIGAGKYIKNGHDLLTVENFYGTFLKKGMEIYFSSDVDVYKNIVISPKYWANAVSEYRFSGTLSDLQTYTKANANGMELGDLEWTEISNVTIEKCNCGVLSIAGTNANGNNRTNMFSASFYNLTVTGCSYGVKLQYMDERWGVQISNSTIQGTEYDIYSTVTNGAVVKIAGVTLVTNRVYAAASGGINYTKYNASNSITAEENHSYRNPDTLSKYLSVYNVRDYGADPTGQSDCSTAVQNALNAAQSNGGGTVYIPPGFYRMNNRITVPANVELRGSSTVANRDYLTNSMGTVLLSYYEGDLSDINDTAADALIFLGGDYAGISGLRIIYPQHYQVYRTSINDYSAYKASFAVMARSDHNYAVNCAFPASYRAIDFRTCDYHYIKRCFFGSLKTAIMVGGRDGIVDGCLNNGTTTSRINLAAYQEIDSENFGDADTVRWAKEGVYTGSSSQDDLFYYVFGITRKNLMFIYVTDDGTTDGTTQTISNCFSFGAYRLIHIADSVSNTNTVSVKAVNVGSDGMNDSGARVFAADGGALYAQNVLWYHSSGYQQSLNTL